MSWRFLLLLLAIGYLIFSIVYLVMFGFDNPRHAVWIGIGGMIVMATVMTLRGRRKK